MCRNAGEVRAVSAEGFTQLASTHRMCFHESEDEEDASEDSESKGNGPACDDEGRVRPRILNAPVDLLDVPCESYRVSRGLVARTGSQCSVNPGRERRTTSGTRMAAASEVNLVQIGTESVLNPNAGPKCASDSPVRMMLNLLNHGLLLSSVVPSPRVRRLGTLLHTHEHCSAVRAVL